MKSFVQHVIDCFFLLQKGFTPKILPSFSQLTYTASEELYEF